MLVRYWIKRQHQITTINCMLIYRVLSIQLIQKEEELEKFTFQDVIEAIKFNFRYRQRISNFFIELLTQMFDLLFLLVIFGCASRLYSSNRPT